ncbi:DUF554 family protein [Kineothrix sp. MB12-C1]|uniref:DUF554 family protein n=1 Tax=Kineothrix sp. MB12-C1 TaxID=3070215 RepID=UPI002F3F5117
MLGTLVNAIAIIVGAVVGIVLKKGLPGRMTDTLMKGVGLCTVFLGISGSLTCLCRCYGDCRCLTKWAYGRS